MRVCGFCLYASGALLLVAGLTIPLLSEWSQWTASGEWEQQQQVANTAPAAPLVIYPERPVIRERPATPSGIVARLICPRLDKELFVRPMAERNLAKGPVWLSETAPPGDDGNTVFAAHRDTHFRFLQDVRPGDTFLVDDGSQTYTYRVAGTDIVSPEDRALLGPQSRGFLTLVTCYPFGYVGPAPLRYIVRAEKVDGIQAAQAPGRTE